MSFPGRKNALNAAIYLRRLRYFVAVAEELHFGRAAERIHVVQSAVSQQVRLLEGELGFPLFERSRHDVKLTIAGEILLDEARAIIGRAEEAIQRVRASADGTVGRLGIGFVDNVLWSLLPPMLRSYRAVFPRVDLALHPLDRVAQIEALQTSTIDIAILPAPLPGSDMESMLLIGAPLRAALPIGHPLAGHRSLPLSALANERFVLFPPRMRSRVLEIIVAACAQAGFTPQIAQEAGQMHTLLAIVGAGLGVTLVPAWVAAAHPADVTYLEIEDPMPDYELIVAWQRTNNNPSVAKFGMIARAVADDLLLDPESSSSANCDAQKVRPAA